MKLIHLIYRVMKLFLLFIKNNIKYFIYRNKKEIKSLCDCDTLIITHNLGGGTLKYERDLIARHPKDYLRMSVNSYGFDFYYSLESPLLKKNVYLKENELYKLFYKQYRTIIINSLITYKNIKVILEYIQKYKETNQKCYVLYLVHDYHCICQNYNLISNNQYCNLNCSLCNQRFNRYTNESNMTLTEWRSLWRIFFGVIDEIRCFSVSSEKLLITAYGEYVKRKIKVVPHDISYIKYDSIEYKNNKEFHLGILGTCQTIAKGRNVVINILRNDSFTFPISLIGSPKNCFNIKKNNIHYVGMYESNQLQEILENEKVNCILFPAIWPETFSYLISELMSFNIPIITFNIGAQCEKIRNYPNGIIVNNEKELMEYLSSKCI